jgi:hypothetical protein
MRVGRTWSAVVAWPLLLGGVAAADAAEIRALGGTFEEDVQEIRAEGGKLTLVTRTRQLPLDTVKSVRFQEQGAPPSERRAVRLHLTTGDVLRGAVTGGAQGDEVVLATRSLGEVRVGFGLLRALLGETTPERERELVLRAQRRQEQLDEVFLRESGAVRGSVTRFDELGITIDTDGDGGSKIGVQAYDLEKVELVAMGLLEEPPALGEGLRVQVRLVDGSALSGPLVGLQGDQLRLRHPLGGKDPLAIPLTRVGELIVQNGAFVYLSDLEPEGVDQRFPPEFSYSVETWGWKRDRNVTGGPLRLGGRSFDKGLGVHSYAALTYRLDGAYKELRATVGLDDACRHLGEPGFGGVVFRVLLDGKPAKEYPSGLVARKGDDPQELKVDLAGAQRLTLVADFDATSLHVLGRADWADAHLIRK